MKNFSILLLFLFLLFSISCSSSSNDLAMGSVSKEAAPMGDAYAEGEIAENSTPESSYANDESDAEMVTESEKNQSRSSNSGGTQSQADIPSKANLKIIKQGEMGMVVKDYAKFMSGLTTKIEAYQGYVAKENERTTSYEIRNSLVLRVPSLNFNALIKELTDGAEEVEYKNIEAIDVTEQFYDLQSRLKVKKEVKAKYESYLKNAKDVEELLTVEKEIRILQEEIEAKEGKLRFLKDKIGYSTLSLSIRQVTAGVQGKAPGFFKKLVRAFANGWKDLLGMIVALTEIWPFFLVCGLFFWWLFRKPRNFRFWRSNKKE